MIQNLSNEKILLDRKIRHKKQLMEGKTNDFNYHTKEANYHSTEAKRLERVVHNLWVEINTDQRKLADLEKQPLNYSK